MTTEEPKQPRLYNELASWWSIFSPPADYEEEAAFFTRLLESGEPPARTVLELGSGGGNNASHLKRTFQMTLVELAPGMLAVSRDLNPECEHVEGDMRSIRLDRLFGRDEWLQLLRETGFQPRVVPFEHSELEPGFHEVFVAVRPPL